MQLLILVQRLRVDQLYLPVLLPNFRIVSMQMSPVVTKNDELAVQNVTQLINFLTGGTGTLSLGSLTPSLAREVISAHCKMWLIVLQTAGSTNMNVHLCLQLRLYVHGQGRCKPMHGARYNHVFQKLIYHTQLVQLLTWLSHTILIKSHAATFLHSLWGEINRQFTMLHWGLIQQMSHKARPAR